MTDLADLDLYDEERLKPGSGFPPLRSCDAEATSWNLVG